MIFTDKSKLLEWNEVKPIFTEFLNVWSNHIPLNFASMAWDSLTKSGLTVYNSEKEYIKICDRAVIISLIYYEFCHRTASHESENFNCWRENTISKLKLGIIKNFEDDEDIIYSIKNSLFVTIGAEQLVAEMWINCLEGNQNSVFTSKYKNKLFDTLLNTGDNDINYRRGLDFIKGVEIDDLSCYQSISGI